MTRLLVINIFFVCVLGFITGCPSSQSCYDDRREPCNVKSNGKCGRCRLEYLEVQGLCVTEDEVERVIRTIETMLGEEDDKNKAKINAVVLETTAAAVTEQPAVPQSTSKNEKRIPGPPAVVARSEDNPPSAADKRVPAVANRQSDPDDPEVNKEKPATIGFDRLLFFGIIVGASLLCVVSLIVAGVCWYRLYKVRKSMEPAEYVGGGYGSPSHPADKDSMTRSDSGDRKLAHSAQMYHYQHNKQQMLALEKSLSDKLDDSDPEDAEENEDGNYTVYECPGLAPAGEMEVSNPLFQAGQNIASPSSPPSPPQSTGMSEETLTP